MSTLDVEPLGGYQQQGTYSAKETNHRKEVIQMRKTWKLFVLFGFCLALIVGCDAFSWGGFQPISLPYVNEERPFKIMLDRAPDGMRLQVFCRARGDLIKLEITTRLPNGSRTLELPQAVICDDTERQVLDGIVFKNSELIPGQNLDFGFNAETSERRSLNIYTWGYTFRVDDAGKFYVQK
jgi:hypothetical protein